MCKSKWRVTCTHWGHEYVLEQIFLQLQIFYYPQFNAPKNWTFAY
jgi:hypothetical protein